MVTFVCDDAAVEAALRKLVDRVVGLGGRISADAEIVCQDGNLSIRCPATDRSEDELVFVPEAALIPAAMVSLALEGDRIVVESVDGELDSARRGLLDLMIEIYNLTGKIAGFRAASPFLRHGGEPAIVKHLLAGRDVPVETPDPGAPDFDDRVVTLFMKSRTLGYKFDGGASKTPVLMPVIDSLNHHPAGARFRPAENGDRKGMAVNVSQPLAGSTECFARYGHYDALDTYLAYAYVETNAPFVRSVPCVLKVPGLGRITVMSRAGERYRGPLAKEIKDLRMFMPAVTAEAPDHVRASHLIIPGPTAKFALRRVLGEVMKLVDPTQLHELLIRRIAQAERDLLVHNIGYYKDLDRIPERSAGNPATGELRRLAEVQRARIQAYIDAINSPGRR